jgi:hypothetical protein
MIIEVFEVDQWSAQDLNRQKLTPQQLQATDNEIHGNSADQVRLAFGGGHVYRKQVDDTRRPDLGYVWFTPGDGGVLKIFKSNYDTSD